MKTFLKHGFIFLLATLLLNVRAADQVRLRPVAASFGTIVPAAIHRAPAPCALLLMSLVKGPQPLTPASDAVVVIGTKPCGQNEIGLSALRFLGEPNNGAESSGEPYQFLSKTFKPDDLQNPVNSEAVTGGFLKKVLGSDKIGPGTSIVVAKDSFVDTSLLIKTRVLGILL